MSSIDSLPEHILRPHVRPIQPLPVSKDGHQFVALRDPTMLMDQTLVVPPQAVQILQHFQGKRTLRELAEQFNGNLQQFVELAERLDKLGLLWGPTFEKLEAERWESLRSAGSFPIRASGMLGDDEAACREALDRYFDDTEDPEVDAPAIAIVAPHLDYARGWPNYAAAYYGLRGMEAPDRVVVLGTNHFGLGDGVVVTELGFETPFGRCRTDGNVISRLVEAAGKAVVADQLDHLPEHSIELQVPWIQYCFGDVPIVGALIPDPIAPFTESDGDRTSTEAFVGALAGVLEEIGGRTFFIASSDLSHVGPQFGEPRIVDERRRMDVERHDREMMAKFLAGDPDEFVAAMRWNKNPTRWCSIGNMTALLMLTKPGTIELLDYRQAYDERGSVLVSSAAMMLGGGREGREPSER